MRVARLMVTIAVIAGLGVGCGDKKAKKSTFDIAGEFAKVTAARAALTEARNQLETVRGKLAKLQKVERLTPQQSAEKTQLESQLKQAQSAFDEAFNNDQSQLSAFLNVVLNEESLRSAPETRKALDLYAQEALVNAKDFMNRAGDYRRAIELLETAEGYFTAVNFAPPPELATVKAEAKSRRYLTKERFDLLKKGMTEDQVKVITGTPFYANIRENEVKGRKIVTWLFNREDGEVAGLYFEKGKLYALKWNVKE